MLLCPGVLEVFLEPIGIRVRIPTKLILSISHISIDALCTELHGHPILELGSVKELTYVAKRLVGKLTFIRNGTLTLLTRLSGNQHDTITSLSTVDGSRSSVLQNLH